MTTADTKDWLLAIGRAVYRRRTDDLQIFSQPEFARTAGVARNTVADLERGKRWPRDRGRRKIEDALKWTPGTLDAMRRGVFPEPQAADTGSSPKFEPWLLAVAREFAAATQICMEILAEHPNDPRARAAATSLDTVVYRLETALAASLPDSGSAFRAAAAALKQLHEIRGKTVAPLADVQP